LPGALLTHETLVLLSNTLTTWLSRSLLDFQRDNVHRFVAFQLLFSLLNKDGF